MSFVIYTEPLSIIPAFTQPVPSPGHAPDGEPTSRPTLRELPAISQANNLKLLPAFVLWVFFFPIKGIQSHFC